MSDHETGVERRDAQPDNVFYLNAMNRPYPMIVADVSSSPDEDVLPGQMRVGWSTPMDRGMHHLRTHMRWVNDDLPTTTRDELRNALKHVMHDVCVAALLGGMSADEVIAQVEDAISDTVKLMSEDE